MYMHRCSSEDTVIPPSAAPILTPEITRRQRVQIIALQPRYIDGVHTIDSMFGHLVDNYVSSFSRMHVYQAPGLFQEQSPNALAGRSSI